MTEVEAGDLFDFATTTGHLYERHVMLALATRSMLAEEERRCGLATFSRTCFLATVARS